MKNGEMTISTINDLKFAERTFNAEDMKDMLADQGWVPVD